ncbi:MAG: acyl-CoA dehydratase activase-related protein [Firmicutes bacterium]|nr:acyl-CoA dehydratase activase-related protein [Bacillota bacterium]
MVGAGLGVKAGLSLRAGATVGLPRALLFYELYPYWKVLLEGLGLRPAVSGPTTREVVEGGCRHAVDEACLPVKAFYGHVVSLVGKVDALFLPRVVSVRPGTYTCPKLLGLPDMVRHNVRGLPRLVVADFDATRPGRGLAAAGERLARSLGAARGAARRLVDRALQALGRYREALTLAGGVGFEEASRLALSGAGAAAPHPPRPPAPGAGPGDAVPGWAGEAGWRAGPRVAVVGHAYNLFDPGANLGLLRRLAALGCRVITSESLTEAEVQAESVLLSKEIFWSTGRRVLAAVTRFTRERLVEGIVHVVSFGCGPDSMVGEIAEREVRRCSDLPYMVLTMDEHSGEAGLQTRLEAFVDMVGRRGRSSELGGHEGGGSRTGSVTGG